ncbi:hypothetical protein SARC_13792 [Sphaeroforma arctica JP610]|uniref:Uncharacterized protein n=1 Tax=Sphaeroforma arctica JP610 TaxID=667725 RepID=A0A0L0FC49_9EUKA|nr:hypothetical protein SARC_13792 [Sphaeroforma arctica JP610]KNC73648.1 hypothetical protein SARC_13792 [Sphaeroforma arctica JP610]|eukprot:XP_014147550.1 hypothetical protein SARC_13792 [Sphaeroforma arctica JP610]
MLTKTTNGLDALDDVLNARLAKQEKRMDVPELRALRIKDFEQAKKEVSASTSEDGKSIQELRKWNDQFGDGDKGKNWQKLTYFI